MGFSLSRFFSHGLSPYQPSSFQSSCSSCSYFPSAIHPKSAPSEADHRYISPNHHAENRYHASV